MKNFCIYFLSIILALSSVLFLVSCGNNTTPEVYNGERISTKASTSEAVQIVEVPKSEDEILKIFNAALNYVDGYCYAYTKEVKCTVSNLSIGDLSSVSNANNAFRSIFGETDITKDYNYETSKDDFDANFVMSGFNSKNIDEASAKQDGDNIVVTVTLPDENNPTSNGLFSKLGGNHQTPDTIKSSLSEFSSSAKTINVSASNISITEHINASDSRLVKLEINYTESYSLSGVTLVKMDTDAVSGISKTVITYSDIG